MAKLYFKRIDKKAYNKRKEIIFLVKKHALLASLLLNVVLAGIIVFGGFNG